MDTKELPQQENWLFHLGDIPDAWKKDRDDSTWQAVRLPHDWSVARPFSRSCASGTGYVEGGVGWYRHAFYLPETCRGKHISVCFDGVYKNSCVWCNSYYLGNRPNGYAAFRYDISDQAAFGETPNVLCVRVEHTDIADSRWFTGSGITRPVSVLVEEPVHIAPHGVFFTSPESNEKTAGISVSDELVNETDTLQEGVLRSILMDAEGTVRFSADCPFRLEAGQSGAFAVEGSVAHPHLWSPETPYLYKLTTHVLCSADSYIVDTCRVGLRSFRFDPDAGFFLNGVNRKLKGVCLHEDAGCLGAAVPPEVWQYRLQKLKDMGCNAIRMSHNPHASALYALCDEMGFLVMDEAFDEWEGPKNKWSTGHNVYPPKHEGYYLHFPAWQKKDLQAMVRRGRNHPSIILWSIGNEIDYPNDPYCHPLFQSMTGNNDANKPAAERQYSPDRPNAERLAPLCAMLAREVWEIDTTRPVTVAAAFPELSAKIGFIEPLSVVGYNYKEHLYVQSHREFPRKTFLGSENSHSLEAWRAVTDNAFIAGQFLWTGIDYLGEARGWPAHGSEAGLLTTAGFAKPGYYRRQALWSETPVVHLVTGPRGTGDGKGEPFFERWNYTPGEIIEARCYTNQPSAELFLNGRSIGVRLREAGSDHIPWQVPFESGELSVQSGECADTLFTAYAASGLRLTRCALQPSASLPEGSRLRQVEIMVCDQNGHWVESDASLLHVTVERGTLVGIDNGDLADTTDYTAPYRRAFHGRLMVYLRRDAADVPSVVHITGEYFEAASEV